MVEGMSVVVHVKLSPMRVMSPRQGGKVMYFWSFCFMGELGFLNVVVVVGPTPPPKNGGGVQQPFLRTSADGIPHLTGIHDR